MGSRGRSSAEQSGNTGCTRRMLLLRLSRPRSQAPPPPRPTADTCGARLPFTPGLRQTSHPPREETPMNTQSPRAVGNPSLGVGTNSNGGFSSRTSSRVPPPRLPRWDFTSGLQPLSHISVSQRAPLDRRTGTNIVLQTATPPFSAP